MLIPWHSKTWDQFSRALSRKQLPHALLLTGAYGVGKKIFAEKMVKSLLCLDSTNNIACENCQACKTYQAAANPDFMHIQLPDGKQQIGVDQIRALSEFLNYSRSFSGYRVVLLESAERMNKNAANSLLKSLEEPAESTVIILLATHLSKIIPTIKSRCQLLTLPMPPRDKALLWINDNNKELTNPVESLEMASGSPILALEIPVELLEDKIKFANDLHEVVCELKSVTEIAKKWEKFDHELLLNWQLAWIQSLIKNTSAPNKKILTESESATKILGQFKTCLTSHQQWHLYEQLIKQKQYIHTSVNPLIHLENMLMLWLQASSLQIIH